MKTLETSKLFAAISYNRLRNVAPKDFPNVAEMEKSETIIDTIGATIPEFVQNVKDSEALSTRIIAENIDEDDAKEMQVAFIKKSRQLEETKGGETVKIEFETDDFNTFFQLFERWGKDWFGKVGEYLKFRKQMNETNQQPKEEKAAKK